MTEKLFDALAVSIKDARVKWVVADKAEEDAEAIVKMAVARQGVSECFFTTEPAGKYKVGDSYRQEEKKSDDLD